MKPNKPGRMRPYNKQSAICFHFSCFFPCDWWLEPFKTHLSIPKMMNSMSTNSHFWINICQKMVKWQKILTIYIYINHIKPWRSYPTCPFFSTEMACSAAASPSWWPVRPPRSPRCWSWPCGRCSTPRPDAWSKQRDGNGRDIGRWQPLMIHVCFYIIIYINIIYIYTSIYI